MNKNIPDISLTKMVKRAKISWLSDGAGLHGVRFWRWEAQCSQTWQEKLGAWRITSPSNVNLAVWSSFRNDAVHEEQKEATVTPIAPNMQPRQQPDVT